MNPTYHMMGQQVTVASLASSSTAEELRSRPTMHTAGARHVAQPRIGLLAVDLGGLNQAVDLCAGTGAVHGVAEQPSLAPDDKWLDRTLRKVVVDRQMACLDIAFQPTPVVRQIVHGLAQHTLRCDLGVRSCPASFSIGRGSVGFFLATDEPLFVADFLEVALDAVQLVDHRQRHIGAARLALGCTFCASTNLRRA